MVMKCDTHLQIKGSERLRELTSFFIEEFLNKVGAASRHPVHLLFNGNGELSENGRKKAVEPINSEIKNGELFINISEKPLKGIPLSALQGWLDWELGSYLLGLHPERFHYNFSELIHPLFPVCGSAENLVRDFVNRLEAGLKSYLVTKMAIDADHASAQLYFHFFRLHLDPEEAEDYYLLAPHGWIRLLFLADRLKEYMPVFLLNQEIVSQNLKSFWWDFHPFWSRKDKQLFDELASIPGLLNGEPYPIQLLEMFKVCKNLFAERGCPE